MKVKCAVCGIVREFKKPYAEGTLKNTINGWLRFHLRGVFLANQHHIPKNVIEGNWIAINSYLKKHPKIGKKARSRRA